MEELSFFSAGGKKRCGFDSLLPVIFLFLAPPAWGLEIHKAFIEYHKFHPSTRTPIISEGQMTNQVSITVDTNLFWDVFWKNHIHGESTSKQFRGVGWEFELYAKPFFWIDVGYRHHSRHCLDGVFPFPYPVEESLFIRLNLKN